MSESLQESIPDYSYLGFYRFRYPPFTLVPDPNFFFPAKTHLDSIEVLTFALNQGSLISVLTGAPGIGKTQVVLTLLSNLKENVRPIIIFNPALTPPEFFQILFKELGLYEERGLPIKEEVLRRLKAHFKESENQNKYLIVIDEAQLLPEETLEELRLITNLNEGQHIHIQIFLIGQPTLTAKLQNEKFTPLRQRISIWEVLRPLEKEEILPYLWFRIKQVSENPEISFEKKFEKLLFKLTGGVPRLINKLMDRTLFIAYVNKSNVIKKGFLKEAKDTFREGLLVV